VGFHIFSFECATAFASSRLPPLMGVTGILDATLPTSGREVNKTGASAVDVPLQFILIVVSAM